MMYMYMIFSSSKKIYQNCQILYNETNKKKMNLGRGPRWLNELGSWIT